MKIVVWNSQGDKWKKFWADYVQPPLAAGEAVLGLLVESGRPPWVVAKYGLRESGMPCQGGKWYNDRLAELKAATGSKKPYLSMNYWAWANNTDAGNIRCSFGFFYAAPHRTRIESMRMSLPSTLSKAAKKKKATKAPSPGIKEPVTDRPGIKHVFYDQDAISYVVIQVHLISGNVNRALRQLAEFMRYVEAYKVPALIVGDMNINLQNPSDSNKINNLISDHNKGTGVWQIMRSNWSTHTGSMGNSELDWGLAYAASFAVAQIGTVVPGGPFGPGLVASTSDHAVLAYS